MKILVIDDEPAVRELFQVALGSWGYDVETAASGADGLERFRRDDYPVVLTDYLMPGMTGFEMALEMQRQAPHVQVILITGSALDAQLAAARELNFTILLKPVNLWDLKAAVDQAAARRGVAAR
jgi:CheY-like chemotaxis protein